MAVWQVQEAKQKFSELLRTAEREPQWITRQGQRVGVLLSADIYEVLTRPKMELSDYLLLNNSMDDLKIERDKTSMRNVDLG